MKFSRIIIVSFVSIFAAVSCHVSAQSAVSVETTDIVPYSCIENAQDSLLKVCTDTSAFIYLKENLSIQVVHEENLNSVTCDWNAPIQQGSILQLRFGILCENKDQGYRVLVGWVSSSMNNGVFLREFGARQLALNKLQDYGQDCIDHPGIVALRKEIKNLAQAGQCQLGGQVTSNKLFSQTFFFVRPGVKGVRFFVRVMDVGSATSQEKIDSFVLSLFKP